ncbi:enoyl-CoA hydratase/isomerase family protein [Chryseobacterium sp. BIGb0232]|uniref:enoyl-CoA hydratase/isomerase family protein n=1 Tax=Chryseobacterium sp. BIGb0232 TaxID=2940598 RepID=UPI000F486A50|nr:enoyl-CoA hydratase-related protein [Chryseobacterium sp. BIGb0232]MCS4301075.1 enoyl-CoA hydratase [Chryseobacterium sp. BIGb0232]ROS20062.1 short chain enoyl-CoA hydratase [Chryseobacterium nakagawai]
MNFETLLFQQHGHIGTLTVNRPQALNSLNTTVLQELKSFADQIRLNKDIRVLIITGSGEKAFVAGADIKAMQGMTPREAEEFSGMAQSAFNAIETLPFAVIAAVNGFALGGGCELALSCDIILASEKAKFGLPEVTLGLLPCFGGTQRLPRAIGLYKAREMVFSGEFYSAEACKEFGFVNRVFAPEELLNETQKLAETIALRGPVAVAKAKQSLNTGFELHITDGLKQEAVLFGELFDTQDHHEGIGAFIEKRNPAFTGK